MIFDNHSHTRFSSDSEMTIQHAMEAADKLGIGLTITEHYDYDYVELQCFQGMDFRFDSQEYWQTYEPCRSEKVQLGVEIGLTDTAREANEAFAASVPFDEVIGAIHIVDRMDLYYPNFYEGKTKEEAYTKYLRIMAEMIRTNDFFDVLAHIDYICRYARYEQQGLIYADFAQEIDDVLQALTDKGKVLELNTRRLGLAGVPQELMPIYKRYRELGGRYVSIGSDAHVPENIGMNFDVAQEMAEAANLQIVTFRARKMEFCR